MFCSVANEFTRFTGSFSLRQQETLFTSSFFLSCELTYHIQRVAIWRLSLIMLKCTPLFPWFHFKVLLISVQELQRSQWLNARGKKPLMAKRFSEENGIALWICYICNFGVSLFQGMFEGTSKDLQWFCCFTSAPTHPVCLIVGCIFYFGLCYKLVCSYLFLILSCWYFLCVE